MKNLKNSINFCLLGIIVISVFLFSGCAKSVSEQQAETSFNAQHPYKVCCLPDGRTLWRIKIVNEFENMNHYVYYFSSSDTNTINVNYQQQNGKSRINKTIIIDGKSFQLVPEQ